MSYQAMNLGDQNFTCVFKNSIQWDEILISLKYLNKRLTNNYLNNIIMIS